MLDAAALASLRALDPTGRNRLIERVLAAFKASTGRLIPQLIEAHRSGDVSGVRHVAHTLKSSAASVGGMKLSGICADLELRSRGDQAADVALQVQALVGETDKLLLALDQLSEAGG
ncbi:MAG: hypothetical protein AD742_14305 [Methylibium sp. NZG]|nr:MAG: hypothetical protein AD742_14305 [Methylibium sp. NZG]